MIWRWWSCTVCRQTNYTIGGEWAGCPHNEPCWLTTGERNTCKDGCVAAGRGACRLRALRRRVPAFVPLPIWRHELARIAA